MATQIQKAVAGFDKAFAALPPESQLALEDLVRTALSSLTAPAFAPVFESAKLSDPVWPLITAAAFLAARGPDRLEAALKDIDKHAPRCAQVLGPILRGLMAGGA